MEPQITLQAIEVFTDSGDRKGRLVLIDGSLAAVLVCLGDPVHAPHLLGAWYLEVSFAAALEGRHDLFASLEEATTAIGAALARPAGNPRS